MPYPSVTTVAGLITWVQKLFMHNKEFVDRAVEPTSFLYWINELLDEIYQVVSPERDKQTFTTTVDDWDYKIGTDPVASPISDIMTEILRIDYDGVPLERAFTEEQVTLPTASSTSGTPTYFFEMWDGGSRYLCFDTPPSTAVTVTIFFLKKPDAITATSGAPKLYAHFWSLLTNGVIMKVHEFLGDMGKADYYRTRYWQPGLRRLNNAKHAMTGRKTYQRQYYGATDLLSND